MGFRYSTASKAKISDQILGSFTNLGDDSAENYVSSSAAENVFSSEQHAKFDHTSTSVSVHSVNGMQGCSRRLFFISELGSLRLRLDKILPIDLAYNEGCVTASCYDIDEFGIGSSENEAIEDLKESIVNIYFLYKNEKDNLGPLPQKQWNFLKLITTEL